MRFRMFRGQHRPTCYDEKACVERSRAAGGGRVWIDEVDQPAEVGETEDE